MFAFLPFEEVHAHLLLATWWLLVGGIRLQEPDDEVGDKCRHPDCEDDPNHFATAAGNMTAVPFAVSGMYCDT